jgi:hypothetical protein
MAASWHCWQERPQQAPEARNTTLGPITFNVYLRNVGGKIISSIYNESVILSKMAATDPQLTTANRTALPGQFCQCNT